MSPYKSMQTINFGTFSTLLFLNIPDFKENVQSRTNSDYSQNALKSNTPNLT